MSVALLTIHYLLRHDNGLRINLAFRFAFLRDLTTVIIVEANQKWAKNAPLLMISVAKLYFERNNKPNRHAFHDVGLVLGNLTLQAQSLGLFVHQMGGFEVEKTQAIYHIPDNFEPVAAIAIGYQGDVNQLDADLQKRQLSSRSRKSLEDFVFTNDWGHSYF